jgi:hypothetical protein
MAIDFEALKVKADRKIKVTPILATIAVGKPQRTTFFRIRTGEGWEPVELNTFAPNGSGVDNTPFLVMPDQCEILDEMELLISAKFYLYTVYGSNIMKVDFISQKVNKNGEMSKYHTSRTEAYEAAKTTWIRMKADQDGGFYSWSLAEDTLPEPVWPTKPANLQEAILLAFKGSIIDSHDHPELKKLRGKL